MCGLAGFINVEAQLSRDRLSEIASEMAETLAHRGPNDRGVWVDESLGVALGHRRLSIVDVSPKGHQPMISASGRYVIAYNGEVYNHRDLRDQLNVPFQGHSDTETLLAAIEKWGIAESLRRVNGMFSMAIWDTRQRQLVLARDRLGIKPLYYGTVGADLVFGSELKAVRAYPGFDGQVDRDSLALLLQHSYVPAPHSIYVGIQKLHPGTFITIDCSTKPYTSSATSYWSLKEAAEESDPFDGSESDAIEELDSLLRSSVEARLMSDVPLGAFLSGGIDSSTVVAMMQAQLGTPPRTFSIGFHENEFDESEYAQQVAAHLGTEHVAHRVTAEEAREVIPLLPSMFDEPFADSSQIPTYLVSKLARQSVTVALSGDGGDELFGGYNRYSTTERIWRQIGWLPSGVRMSLAPLMRAASLGNGRLSRRARTLSELIASEDASTLYTRFHTHWKDPTRIVIGGAVPDTDFYAPKRWARRDNLVERLMYVDGVTYLPDDILVKVDRASMAVGLEARVPILDHRVVEFAWRLPASIKFGAEPKSLLKQVLKKYVPPSLTDRPKTGFGLPIDSWIRGPLREWAEELLDADRLRREAYFRAEPIRQKWAEHLAGTQSWHYYLWDVLMFQAWLEAQK